MTGTTGPGRPGIRKAGHDLFLRFEWAPVKPDRVAFKFFIVRGSQQSVVAFELGVNDLSQAEFKRLERFLVEYQHKNLPGDEVTHNLIWLLSHDLSDLDESAWREQVLDLLLCAVAPQTSPSPPVQ